MKRSLTLALTVGLLFGAMTATPARAHHGRAHDWMADKCRYGEIDPGRQSQREMALTISCAVRKWPVPGGVSMAMMVASHESGLNATAKNGSSGACGIYQHIQSYWPGRQNAADRPWFPIGESCTNGRANIIVSIKIAHVIGWEAHWCRWTTYC